MCSNGGEDMNILCIGDVCGSAGAAKLKSLLPKLKREYSVSFTLVNGENSADGNGMAPDEWLDTCVFASVSTETLEPTCDGARGFDEYFKLYERGLGAQKML